LRGITKVMPFWNALDIIESEKGTSEVIFILATILEYSILYNSSILLTFFWYASSVAREISSVTYIIVISL